MAQYHVTSAEEMRALGEAFARTKLQPGVVTLSGELGAGKTTLAQGILRGVGAQGPFTSPTFVLMKRYDLPASCRGIMRVYHVDAYRIGEADLRAQGFVEWAEDASGLVLLEWPERVPGLVPKDALHISCAVEEVGRRVEISPESSDRP